MREGRPGGAALFRCGGWQGGEPCFDGPGYGEPTARAAPLSRQVRATPQSQAIPIPFAVPPDGPAKRGGLKPAFTRGVVTAIEFCSEFPIGPFASPKHKAALRRAGVRRSEVAGSPFIYPSPRAPSTESIPYPNRRAAGRPGDARRPEGRVHARGGIFKGVVGRQVSTNVEDQTQSRASSGRGAATRQFKQPLYPANSVRPLSQLHSLTQSPCRRTARRCAAG